ncbi:hypothetical protein [Natronobacterium gregoryi]|uniref:Uncharacterized protein n=2 Tax=Natronobacterium gregoryi TaxID=44930 RepID=L0AN67_NATGS|nr:hypothetical protein [Natronobacterium gregoryi]AFZ74622.1 hypothetical protein Natgr_3503 [Natronobacterium gregoryi SP2]ELY72557.1 hypothetical protein C490_03173 [Natronobacterium gregoryi SP2]PLK19807.1 hypothetical protein CYV19_12930 [Natronobacterium gregoryi SP2]SFJ30675.1 hypothetical protein SAMN05443661_12140 [Natronobacterium gregoryi]
MIETIKSVLGFDTEQENTEEDFEAYEDEEIPDPFQPLEFEPYNDEKRLDPIEEDENPFDVQV